MMMPASRKWKRLVPRDHPAGACVVRQSLRPMGLGGWRMKAGCPKACVRAKGRAQPQTFGHGGWNPSSAPRALPKRSFNHAQLGAQACRVASAPAPMRICHAPGPTGETTPGPSSLRATVRQVYKLLDIIKAKLCQCPPHGRPQTQH